MALETAGDEAADASTPPRGRRLRGSLVALSVVALAAAFASLHGIRFRDADLSRLTVRARELGLDPRPTSELGRALARAPDPAERRLVLARALVQAVVKPASTIDATRGGDRLEAAAELARGALERQPASWEAAHLTGLAVALERLRERDSLLVTARADWQAPLEAALARFPGAVAPERALAAVWLEIWPALAPSERERAELLLTRAFLDPEFFARAFDRWLEVSGSIENAERLLPDQAESWQRLSRAAAGAGDFGRAAALHERWRRALAAELERRLDRALAAGGASGRSAIDELVARAPADAVFAPLVERALTERPPGPASAELAGAAARWLGWARPLCLTLGCPLAPSALDRLASAAGAEVDPADAAFAALAAGDAPRAERLARRSEALWSEPWASYLLLVARTRLDAGDLAGARAALASVHRGARGKLPARRLAHAAAGPASVLEPTAAARWEPTEWEIHGAVPALALEAERPARAVVVRLARPASRGALLAVEWDGRALTPTEVAAGDETLRLPIAVVPGPHLLRLAPLAGELPAIGLTLLD